MKKLHPEERVMRALNFLPPDRVPILEGFWSEFVASWRQDKKLGEDADIYEYYQLDIRRQGGIAMDQSPWPGKTAKLRETETYTITRDGWNRTLKTLKNITTFQEGLEYPIKKYADLDKLTFEPADLDIRYKGLKESVEKERKNYCVFFKTGGPFSRSARFRGVQQFLMDMLLDTAFAKELAMRMTDLLIDTLLTGLKRANAPRTAVWIADDIASTRALFFSPELYEEVFYPQLKRLCEAIKSTGRKVIYESEGNTSEILDMLIDAGVDVFATLEPRAGMDIAKLKEKYGNKVAYIGNICNVIVLPNGTKRDIEKEVRRVLSIASDGGYIAGSAHSIGSDVPVENYDYMIELLRKYGNYPLT